MGSYPTHRTLALVQAEQAGSTWSQRFFLTRHRLQADTFLKAEVAVEEVCGGDVGAALSGSIGLSSVGKARLVPACGAELTSADAVAIDLNDNRQVCQCHRQDQGTRVRKCRNARREDCFSRSIESANCQMVGDSYELACGRSNVLISTSLST